MSNLARPIPEDQPVSFPASPGVPRPFFPQVLERAPLGFQLEVAQLLDELRATPTLRRVLKLAERESQRLDSPAIESHYTLLMFLREPHSVAGHVLQSLGLTEAAVRQALLDTGSEFVAQTKHWRRRVPYAVLTRGAPAADAAGLPLSESLERFLRIAPSALGPNRDGVIGVEHLLAALVQAPDEFLTATLERLELVPTSVYELLLQVLNPAVPVSDPLLTLASQAPTVPDWFEPTNLTDADRYFRWRWHYAQQLLAHRPLES